MRNNIGLLVLGALVAIVLVSALDAEDTPASSPGFPSASRIWNFHFAGKKKRGDVIELAQLDDPKYGGKALVITHLEMRLSPSVRVQLQEHWQEVDKKGRDGKPLWGRRVIRDEAFSAGVIDSTTEWVIVHYDSNTGIVLAPATRPSLEVSFGNGDVEIWAEGYWAAP
jgi:hypothetical protein